MIDELHPFKGDSQMSKTAFTLAPFTADSPYLEDVAWIYAEIWPDDSKGILTSIARWAMYPIFAARLPWLRTK
jgi:hypothetical protein